MSTERTGVRQLIRQALFELLKTKPFIEITVSDLIQTAGVARVSFYRNYSSISDVIDEFIDEQTVLFNEEIFPVLRGNDERQWRALLFSAFYQIPRRYAFISACCLQNMGTLLGRFNIRIQQLDNQTSGDTLREKYAAFGKFGIIVNVVKKWMDEGMKETPEEMVDYIMSFILLF